jgi:16S rRNA (cytosine967-C5)-methyltransferase
VYISTHLFIINTHIDNNGAVSALPGYEEGLWWVQDVSSRLAGLVLIQSLREVANTDTMSDKVGVDSALSKLHVVDMCAAPGGKTAQLIDAGIGEVCLFSACVVVCS